MLWRVNKALLIAFFLFCSNIIFAQNKFIDSLKLWLKNYVPQDSQRAVTLHKISFRLSEINPRQSWQYAHEANALAIKINNKVNIGQSYINFAILEGLSGNIAESQQYYRQALMLFEQSGWLRGQSICLNNIAENYKIHHQYTAALNTTFKALEINKKIDEKRGQAINYEQIGDLYLRLGNNKKSLLNLTKGLDIAQRYASNDAIVAQLLLSLARNNIASKNFTAAQQNLTKAYDYAQKQNEKILEINTQIEWANWNIEQKMPKKAIEWLNKALENANKFGEEGRVEAVDIYQKLAKTYTEIGNYKQAFSNQLSYQSLNDTLQWHTTKTQSELAKIKYNVTEKEKENQLLKRNSIEQASALNRQAIWLLSLGVALGLLLVGFLYAMYRNRINIVKQKQAESLRNLELSDKIRQEIARNLHDDLGATLSGVSMLSKAAQQQLDNQNKNVIETLEIISENALKMVGTIRELTWTTKYADEKISTIVQRMRDFAHDVLSPINIQYFFNVESNELLDVILPSTRQYHLYLIFKELITNVIQYSEAKKVWIEIYKNENELVFVVEDDGKGLENKNNTENGLINIKKRIQEMNARVVINTDAGLRVECYLPC